MKKYLQTFLLVIYRWTLHTGILSTRAGKAIFEGAYWVYKELIEAGEVSLLRDYVLPGYWVVDVGANIGFFTVKFARWVSEGGCVIAIEPEQNNFNRLIQRVRRVGCQHVVSPVHAAAAERSGELKLAIDAHNPANHQLSKSGTPVAAITIDDVMREHGWPAVSLIKIDVQGAEGRVLAGARETLSRYQPVLFIEVDEMSLNRAGTNARALIEDLERSGYRPHALEKGAVSAPLGTDEALIRVRRKGYTDLLFLNPLRAETN